MSDESQFTPSCKKLREKIFGLVIAKVWGKKLFGIFSDMQTFKMKLSQAGRLQKISGAHPS